MQVFLPYADFKKTAQCLDYRRLGKQRVEAFQLVKLMNNPEGKGWRNHPAFRMWDGYDIALIDYALTICSEWISRGYKDTLTERFLELRNSSIYQNRELPKFIGNEAFHASHRSALLFKNYDYYQQFNWSEKPEYNYIWEV